MRIATWTVCLLALTGACRHAGPGVADQQTSTDEPPPAEPASPPVPKPTPAKKPTPAVNSLRLLVVDSIEEIRPWVPDVEYMPVQLSKRFVVEFGTPTAAELAYWRATSARELEFPPRTPALWNDYAWVVVLGTRPKLVFDGVVPVSLLVFRRGASSPVYVESNAGWSGRTRLVDLILPLTESTP